MGVQRKHIVEARRCAETEVCLRHDRVDPARNHVLPRSDGGSPQLGERDVEVDEVIGVEDDVLRVALGVAHAQLVYEGLGHGGDVIRRRSGPLRWDAIEEYLNGRDPRNPPPEFPASSQIDGELRELRVRFARTRYRVLYQRSRNLIVLLYLP